jgi:hypothetical protein
MMHECIYEKTLEIDWNRVVDAFDIFWENYAGPYGVVHLKKVHDSTTVLEYVIYCEWCSDHAGERDLPVVRLRFQSLSPTRQRLEQYSINPIDDPQPDAELILLDYQPAVTTGFADKILSKFVEYLRDEGYLEAGKSESTPPQDAGRGVGDKKPPFPGFPMTLEGVEKWRQSYRVILKTREEYRNQFDLGYTDDSDPHIDDLREALADMPEWTKRPGASTVRRIVRAGDGGLLE